MKRLSKDDRLRHKRHLRSCEAATRIGDGHAHSGQYDFPQPPGYFLLPAPDDISIEDLELQKGFQTFFEVLEARIATQRVFISFSDTYSASAAGLVLFIAKIDIIIGTYGAGRISCSSLGRTKYINRALSSSGILTLIRSGKYLPLGGELIPIVKGNTGSDIHDLIDAILAIYFNGKIGPFSEQKISTALTEAVLNVHYHAYEGVPEKGIGLARPWWFLTEVAKGTLSLALYDFGIGIPVSLPRKDFFERLSTIFSVSGDAEMIEASLETSRTRTNLDQHGKGGQDIRALVETSVGGHLVIYSNAGVYQITSDGTGAVKKEKFALAKPLRGTLIQWQIPLESFNNELH